MDFASILEQFGYDSTKNLVESSFIQIIEETIAVLCGPQLREYILRFGYLGYESVEFYGVNSRQGLSSDLVKQTLYLHKYYSKTDSFIALENLGDGKYGLIDPTDEVYFYSSEQDLLSDSGCKLFDYILKRFTEESMEA